MSILKTNLIVCIFSSLIFVSGCGNKEESANDYGFNEDGKTQQSLVEQYDLENKTKQDDLKSYAEKSPTEPIFWDDDETKKVCEKVSDMTKSLQEIAANHFKTSMRNISFVRTYKNNRGSCVLVIDTPNGTDTCYLASIAQKGNEFLAHVGEGQLSMVCGGLGAF
jgi:hypothetical protein